MCVYTASLSQVLYNPQDYSGEQAYPHTQTHTAPPSPYPPKGKEEGKEREVEGDNRSDGGRER